MTLTIDQENAILKLTSIVECTYQNQTKASATCFFCRTNSSKIILTTNKHVFENCKTATLYLSVINQISNLVEYISLTLHLGNDILFHSHYDICMLDITSIYNNLVQDGNVPILTLFNESGILTDYSNLHAFQEIIMIGYPGGIINTSCNHPIVRIGITATNIKEKYDNQDIFLTDIPTFGGSSGSPIITLDNNNIVLLGINSQTYNQPTPVYSKPRLFHKRKLVGYVDIPNDIGIAINSCIIKEMLSHY